ncbi:MAG: hypothetical protein UW18_C0017G0018 [Microgenomates group bacterium GW2011_GWF1_44_10]|nr:MAG: hypothetical protein UW18_C0017G0018 [Microgenomates group bacterium GW2011_GWF1_44_10]
MATETEIEVLLSQNKIMGERQDDMRKQLDTDRATLDQLKLDLDKITNGQKAIFNQMADFKEEMRQMLKDTIEREVPRAVKKAISKEFELIEKENPRKKIVRKSLWRRMFRK